MTAYSLSNSSSLRVAVASLAVSLDTAAFSTTNTQEELAAAEPPLFPSTTKVEGVMPAPDTLIANDSEYLEELNDSIKRARLSPGKVNSEQYRATMDELLTELNTDVLNSEVRRVDYWVGVSDKKETRLVIYNFTLRGDSPPNTQVEGADRKIDESRIFVHRISGSEIARIELFDEYLRGKGFSIEKHETQIDNKASDGDSEGILDSIKKNPLAAKVVGFGLIFTFLVGSLAVKRGIQYLSFRKSRQNQGAPEDPLGLTHPDSLEYRLKGGSQPTITFKLHPNQFLVTQAGALLFSDEAVKRNIVTGDSLGFSRGTAGFARRFLAGESFFFTKLHNQSSATAEVALSPSDLGELLPIELGEYQNGIFTTNGAFFAASPGVELAVERRVGASGLLSGMGLFQQRFRGKGTVILLSPGSVQCLQLDGERTIQVDSDGLFAWEPSVEVKLKYLGVTEAAFGGEGLVMCVLSGKGKVWIASGGRADNPDSNSSSGGLVSSIYRFFAR